MSSLTILIVDDEAGARRTLRVMLERHFPQHRIVGECQDLPEAVLTIRELQPQVVFMDVEMPRYSGLQLGKFFLNEDLPFKLIYLTGYSEYALQAFELAALDYLLKPLTPELLNRAVSRAEEWYQDFSKDQTRGAALVKAQIETLTEAVNEQVPKKLIVKTGTGLVLIPVEDITHLEADGSYCTIHLLNGTQQVVSKRLGEFDHLLFLPHFKRVHRSYLVNMLQVRELQHRGPMLELNTGVQVAVSAEKKHEVLQWLHEEYGHSS